MPSIRRTVLGFLFSLLALSTALAQTQPPIQTPQPDGQPSTVIVTATASNQRVRYASLGEVNQTRLQVFSAEGSQVYDSDFKLGNLIDWQLQDQQGARLADGSYLFLVTVKDFSGNLTQKYGTAQIDQGQVSLQQTSRDELPSAQSTALDSNKLSATLSTVDRIGVAATTDVTTTTTNSPQQKTSKQATTAGTNIATAGAIPKFSDNSGNLTNSIIAESNNQVFVAGNQLITPVGATPTYEVLAGSDPSSTVMLTTNSSNFGWQIAPTNGSNDTLVQVLGQTFASAPNRGEFGIYLGTDANSAFKVIQRSGSELFRVNRLGNVGIGNNNPQAKLDVAGNLKISGGGSLIFPDNTVQTTAATGGSASQNVPPFVWVCTPLFQPNSGGGTRVDVWIFNASASTANVSIHPMDKSGSNLAGVTIPGSASTYPGQTAANTTTVASANTLDVTWNSPGQPPDTNVAYTVKVTSDQYIVVNATLYGSSLAAMPCQLILK